MKKSFWIIAAAAALIVILVAVGYSYPPGTNANAKCGNTSCAKFVDSNNDGICDNCTQCRADGTCNHGKNCQNFKDENKDGKCDVANCTAHQNGKGCGGQGKCGSQGKCGCGNHAGCPRSR